VNKGENFDLGRINSIPAKFGESDKSRRARIDHRGDSMVQAKVRVNPKAAALVPMAVNVDEAGTDILPGHVDQLRIRSGFEVFSQICDQAISNGNIPGAIDLLCRIDNVTTTKNQIVFHVPLLPL
jgi:hypothetical protein